MARNEEKAQSVLSRWTAMQGGDGPALQRRPYIAEQCTNLNDAEKWRRQILQEISRKVSTIQNAGLGEFKIRDLNDEINKLLREKHYWERHIVSLGGPNYYKSAPRMLDGEGKEIASNRGYKYFGAARDLPGVRELFKKEAPIQVAKTSGELYRDVDADYYGYRDDDDGVLEPLELAAEPDSIKLAVSKWEAKHTVKTTGDDGRTVECMVDDVYAVYAEPVLVSDDECCLDTDMYMKDSSSVTPDGVFRAHVPLPSQKEVEAFLLQRRKHALLEKYASESLRAQENEAMELVGKQ